ncbi:hypothetical protein ACJX0J_022623, partial [Zea mays]
MNLVLPKKFYIVPFQLFNAYKHSLLLHTNDTHLLGLTNFFFHQLVGLIVWNIWFLQSCVTSSLLFERGKITRSQTTRTFIQVVWKLDQVRMLYLHLVKVRDHIIPRSMLDSSKTRLMSKVPRRWIYFL